MKEVPATSMNHPEKSVKFMESNGYDIDVDNSNSNNNNN